MTYLDLDSITLADLARFWAIEAVAENDECEPVWKCNKLTGFVGQWHPGQLAETAFIKVPTLSDEDLEPVYAKLAEVDAYGDKRLVR